MRRVLAFLILSLMLLMPSALAHPGGTDSIGGHYENSTGLYHFHHGYSAHHHPGGVCPYDSSRTYPTDKPPRATQTSRPGTVSRSYTIATFTPPPSATKASGSKSDSMLFDLAVVAVVSGAGLSGLAAFLSHHKKRSG